MQLDVAQQWTYHPPLGCIRLSSTHCTGRSRHVSMLRFQSSSRASCADLPGLKSIGARPRSCVPEARTAREEFRVIETPHETMPLKCSAALEAPKNQGFSHFTLDSLFQRSVQLPGKKSTNPTSKEFSDRNTKYSSSRDFDLAGGAASGGSGVSPLRCAGGGGRSRVTSARATSSLRGRGWRRVCCYVSRRRR